MKILKEGDKERAFHPDLNKVVDIVYQYRTFYYEPEDIKVYTLVGIHIETETALIIPPQSEIDIGRAIKAKK